MGMRSPRRRGAVFKDSRSLQQCRLFPYFVEGLQMSAECNAALKTKTGHSAVPRKLFIETVGCQMNVLDSEMVVASLRRHGYSLADSAADADTILFNTCSVREHAEEKVYANLAKLKKIKAMHPEKIIGVMGCMAQKDQRVVFERAPYVDLVVGPGQLQKIPELLERIGQGQGKQMAVSLGRRDGSQEEIRRSHETFDRRLSRRI